MTKTNYLEDDISRLSNWLNLANERFKNNEQGFTIYEAGINPVDLDTS
jgi:hypothetical protein